MVYLVGFIILGILLYAQDKAPNQEKGFSDKDNPQTVRTTDSSKKKDAKQPALSTSREESKKGWEWKDWLSIIGLIVALGSLYLSYHQRNRLKKYAKLKKIMELETEIEFLKREKEESDLKKNEGEYCNSLKKNMESLQLKGLPGFETKPIKLDDLFVSLQISDILRTENRFDPQKQMTDFEIEPLTPEDVIKKAFNENRLLLIIGGPGSGKTILLKYYAVNCLKNNKITNREFGFEENVLPVYLPLRELEYENDVPAPIEENLANWSQKHMINISAEQFRAWLQKLRTLVLLDGIDEISSMKHRQKVCHWIKNMYSEFGNACFVVTSRVTGYRKLYGIELEMPHLRADIMDFSQEQQEDFLKKWFQAQFLAQLVPEGAPEQAWREKQEKLADQKSTTIIEFLRKEENKPIQELATVPMLLQIIAIICKDHQHLPKIRTTLYDATLNYLLEYRDRQKGIEPVLSSDEARRVLAPYALWIHEKLQRDEAPKRETLEFMQPILDTLQGQPKALTFCENLRDRAGLIADYHRDHYIFRHKSFREFLCGIQLKEDAYQSGRIETLIGHFKEEWWSESLRFFMSKSNDKIFDRFMRFFFQSEVSQKLENNQQTLLQHLVREAPQKKIDALADFLNSDKLNNIQRRCVMDCLKTIGTPEAIKAIETADKKRLDKDNLSYAEDIVAEAASKVERIIEKPGPKELFLGSSFRNPFEYNVEYIKIPGGTYKYSVSEEMVTVPDLFFCKYPVTNKQYRQFIFFLEGNEKDLNRDLRMGLFAEKLLQFSESIKGYKDFLGKNPKKWQEKFRSPFDDDKRLNGDDQPVVSVTWYAARAYCFWLSCLEAVITMGDKLEDINRVASIYRLPTGKEWEWAAGGELDGSIREYPWTKDKGAPRPTLANYGENVNITTPVGRYPEGATPQGLLDMAGNVWEWMGSSYDTKKGRFALRGGSWFNIDHDLRCTSRIDNIIPHYQENHIGFRTVRSQS